MGVVGGTTTLYNQTASVGGCSCSTASSCISGAVVIRMRIIIIVVVCCRQKLAFKEMWAVRETESEKQLGKREITLALVWESFGLENRSSFRSKGKWKTTVWVYKMC